MWTTISTLTQCLTMFGRAEVKSSDIAKQVIRDIKRILQRQKGTTAEREYLFAHMNQIKGRLGWR